MKKNTNKEKEITCYFFNCQRPKNSATVTYTGTLNFINMYMSVIEVSVANKFNTEIINIRREDINLNVLTKFFEKRVFLVCYKYFDKHSNLINILSSIKLIDTKQDEQETGDNVAIEGVLKNLFNDFFISYGTELDELKILHLYFYPPICSSTLHPLINEEVSVIGRYDSVYKNRFHVFDIMSAKKHPALTKKNPKNNELKKQQRDYDFYRFKIELD